MALSECDTSASLSCFIHKVEEYDQPQVQSEDQGDVGEWAAGCAPPLSAAKVSQWESKELPSLSADGHISVFPKLVLSVFHNPDSV